MIRCSRTRRADSRLLLSIHAGRGGLYFISNVLYENDEWKIDYQTHKPFVITKIGWNRRLWVILNEEPFGSFKGVEPKETNLWKELDFPSLQWNQFRELFRVQSLNNTYSKHSHQSIYCVKSNNTRLKCHGLFPILFPYSIVIFIEKVLLSVLCDSSDLLEHWQDCAVNRDMSRHASGFERSYILQINTPLKRKTVSAVAIWPSIKSQISPGLSTVQSTVGHLRGNVLQMKLKSWR